MKSRIKGYLTNETFKKIISALTGAKFTPSASKINGPVTEQAGQELLEALKNSGGILPPYTESEVGHFLNISDDNGTTNPHLEWEPVDEIGYRLAGSGFHFLPDPAATGADTGKVPVVQPDGSYALKSIVTVKYVVLSLDSSVSPSTVANVTPLSEIKAAIAANQLLVGKLVPIEDQGTKNGIYCFCVSNREYENKLQLAFLYGFDGDLGFLVGTEGDDGTMTWELRPYSPS